MKWENKKDSKHGVNGVTPEDLDLFVQKRIALRALPPARWSGWARR